MRKTDVASIRKRLAQIEGKLAALATRNDAKSLALRERLSIEWDTLQSGLRGRPKSKRP